MRYSSAAFGGTAKLVSLMWGVPSHFEASSGRRREQQLQAGALRHRSY